MSNSLLYICCPPAERPATEHLLKSAGFQPRWAESLDDVLLGLAERESVVLADFADDRTQAIVQGLRRNRPTTFLLAISDPRRQKATDEIEASALPVVLHRPLNAQMLALLSAGALIGKKNGDSSSLEHPPLFAESPAMRACLEAVALAAVARCGVLVSGESGSGRALIACEIHQQSERRHGPFIRVDCADAVADELERRLFGSVDSTSAGATDRRRVERLSSECLIAAARRGTLFLAHVADMPARVQARLARLLRDDEAAFGESRQTVPLDLRPIASGDLSWDTAVSEGRIRSDLAKRLAAVRIAVPSLRTRREDIPALAGYILSETCAAQRVPLKSIESPAVALLAALPWRGNGRELRALISSLVAQVPSSSLRLEDLLTSVRLDGAPKAFVPAGTLREARQRFERDYITAVLEHHKGRIGEAARSLGIQRTNLYRKMRELKVAWRSNGAHSAAG